MDSIAFARGVPAPEMLPVRMIEAASQAALQHDATRILSYGPGGGYGPLREQLAEIHGVRPSQVLATTGSLHGFALFVEHLAQSLPSESRLAFVENPTYDRPLIVLDRNGYRVRAIDTDAHGVLPDQLEAALKQERPAVIYLIPSFQNPSGATLSEDRRSQVLDLAARYDVPIFEDDPYGQLHFDTPAPTTLFAREHAAEVIYANSYSKTISPGLRVGYLVLPESRAASLEQYANDTYISPTLLGQAVVSNIISGNALPNHLASLRTQLSKRSNIMCDAVDRLLPAATYTRPTGGYFLWVNLPDALETRELLVRSSELGATFVAGDSFGPHNASSLRLAFSSPKISEITLGIERIASATSLLVPSS